MRERIEERPKGRVTSSDAVHAIEADRAVVDASVLAPAMADGGNDGQRYRRRLRGDQLAGPGLLRLEVTSVLRRQIQAKTPGEEQALRALDDLLDPALVVYPTAALQRGCWALRHNVATYDACYGALAERIGCTLLTADHRLARTPGITCRVEMP